MHTNVWRNTVITTLIPQIRGKINRIRSCSESEADDDDDVETDDDDFANFWQSIKGLAYLKC